MAKINPIRPPEYVDTNEAASTLQATPDFSLVLGGPLYQMYLRTRLARPALELVVRRVLVLSLICWLPLLLLSAVGGHLLSGVTVPFLRDPEVHVRFLAALPLLIGSEVLVHRRMRMIVGQFLDRGIIANEDRARFDALIASALRIRNSVTLEVVIFVLMLTVGYWGWRHNVSLTVSTWYIVRQGGAEHMTAAGYWYAFVSLTFFRFVLFRWYLRLFIWYRFLWQVKKMPLHFNLYHPDRVGGLGFLAGSSLALSPVMIAQSMVLSALIFDRILYAGAKLPNFKFDIAGAVLFLMLLAVIPLGFFAAHLEQAERLAKREFGTLASRYVNDFRRKWVLERNEDTEQLLGTSDIQSLADIGNSYSVVAEIRLFPISKQALIRLFTMIVLPLLPLTFTMFPLDQAIRGLFKLMF